MNDHKKGLTRREFLEIVATGTAAATLGGTFAFSAEPKRGGSVTCANGFLIQTPDPQRYTGGWAQQAMALSWDGLTTSVSLAERARIVKEKGPDAVPDVMPALAENWEIEKGGTRYVFHLRKGIKFHNGKEFDSEDVKWSWERIKDPVHRSTVRKILTYFLKTIETPDRYTVVANLETPYGAFLSANETVILPKDCMPHGVIWGVTPTFKPDTPAPPGTGPFKMVKFQQKYEAVFERFDDYHVPGLPYLDRITYKVVSKDGPRTMALRSGDVDYIFPLDTNWQNMILEGHQVNQVINLKNEGISAYTYLSGSSRTIFLNCHELKDTPFKDVRVRQALDYCIDKKKLVKTLFGRSAVPMDQGFHPDISPWGYTDIKPKRPDIEMAKKLLEEAGYPNGLDVELRITPTYGRQDLMAQIIQQMVKPAGFRVKIVSKVGVQFYATLRTYGYQMQHFALVGPDPMRSYYSNLHTDPNKPYNGYAPVTGIKDPIMDKLLDEVAYEIDMKKRKAAFKKVVQRSIDQSYFIPFMMQLYGIAWSNKLKNFRPWEYSLSERAFREAWIET